MLEKFKNIKDDRWLKRYLRFIEIFGKDSIYKKQIHKHHILPQSIYPEFGKLKDNKWNKAELSPRAHYLAHYMLAKALGGSMWYAWNRMNNGSEDYSLNSKLYEDAKKQHSKIVSKYMTENNPSKRPEVVAKIKKANTGKKASKETRAKMSKARKGKPTGYKHTEETKEKLRESRKNQKCPRLGIKTSEETKLKISKAQKGKMTGLRHFKVNSYILFNKFGVVKYVINESLTSFNKKVDEPILKIKKQERYKTRFRKYKQYEGCFLFSLKNIKFKIKG